MLFRAEALTFLSFVGHWPCKYGPRAPKHPARIRRHAPYHNDTGRHKGAPIVPEEEERLAILRAAKLLDTKSDPRFDHLTPKRPLIH